MDVHVRHGHEWGVHPGATALAGIGLLCPGTLGRHRFFLLGHDDLSSLGVFDQRPYLDFELPATRQKYYQGWSDPG